MDDRIARACIRILSRDHEVVGTGFLVSRRLALTCAHVVEDALGYEQPTEFAPLAPLRIDLLGSDGRTAELEADVVGWYPMRAGDPDSDVAVLALKKRAPPWARPAPIGSAARVDMKFRTCGYPPANPLGVNVTGKVAGAAGHGIQLEPTGAKDILRGFSGAAVWEEPDGGVIGMVHSTEASRDVRVAWMASGTHLARLPELTYQARARRLFHRFRRVVAGTGGAVGLSAVAAIATLRMCSVPTCASVAAQRGLRAATGEALAVFAMGQPAGILSTLKAGLTLEGLRHARVEQVDQACGDSNDAGEMVVTTGANAVVWLDDASSDLVKLRFPARSQEQSDVLNPLIAGFSMVPSLPIDVTATASLGKGDRPRCLNDYLRARIAMGSGNMAQANVWAKAAADCQGDMMPFKDHAELDLLSGYVLLQMEMFKESNEVLKRVRAVRSDERASIYSGLAYTARKLYDDAEVALKAAIAVNNRSYEANNNLGVLYKLRAQEATDATSRSKFRDMAMVAFNQAERLAHEAGAATANKGLIYYLFDGDLEGAVRYLRQALNDSRSALVGNALGYLLRVSGHLEESREAYSEAIRLNPNAGFLENNIGLVDMDSGNHRAAIQHFDRALQKDPTSLVSLMNRAIAYEVLATHGELDKRDKALSDYTTVIQRGTGTLVVKARFNRATLYWNKEEHEPALQDLEAVLQVKEPFLPAYPPYIDLLRELKRGKQASEVLKEARAHPAISSPTTQEQYEVRGMLTERDDSLVREKRLRMALADYDQALARRGEPVDIRERRFRVFVKLNECAKAREELAELKKMGVSEERRDELLKKQGAPCKP